MSFVLELLSQHIHAVDFGMFIIIWMVQLIIYPSFAKI